MSRGRGRRYNEPQLNKTKVLAVVVAIVVVIMFIFVIGGLFKNTNKIYMDNCDERLQYGGDVSLI